MSCAPHIHIHICVGFEQIIASFRIACSYSYSCSYSVSSLVGMPEKCQIGVFLFLILTYCRYSD